MEGTSHTNRIVYDNDVPEGLARGALKIDGNVVPAGSESPSTGEERIAKSDLYHGVATEALKIHDELLAAGEEIPNAVDVRAHLVRVIEESAQPWDKNK